MKRSAVGDFDLATLDATLRLLETDFKQGNSFALMVAICECAEGRVPLPNWVSKAYKKAFESVHSAQVRTWDEAFGKPHHGNTSWLRTIQKNMLAVGRAITEHRNAGGTLKPEDYEDIGDKFHLNRQQVSEIWKLYKVIYPDADPVKQRKTRKIC